MTELITLAATPAAIIALVNLARQLGMPVRTAPVAAVILGIALALADYLLSGAAWYQAAVGGLMLGLAAAGLHDLAGRASSASTRPADADRSGHQPVR